MTAAGPTSLLCLLYHLTDPPLVYIGNFTLTWKPINTKICPHINGDKYVKFYLYTRRNYHDPQILQVGNDSLLSISNMNFNQPTVIFMHGFTEYLHAPDIQVLKNYFLKRGEYNYIAVDARKLLAGPYYVEAVINTRFIGEFIALFVDYLVGKGLRLPDLHVIGFSLGAHISGFVGNYVRSGRLSRITGLDPAGPLFYTAPPEHRLDPGDADFVDVIHTSSYLFGYGEPTGDIDFYPNGGGPIQPGCNLKERLGTGSINEVVFCDHYRAFRLFALTLLEGNKFPARKCLDKFMAHFGKCLGNVTYMGIDVDRRSKGVYYIYTGQDGRFVS